MIHGAIRKTLLTGLSGSACTDQTFQSVSQVWTVSRCAPGKVQKRQCHILETDPQPASDIALGVW